MSEAVLSPFNSCNKKKTKSMNKVLMAVIIILTLIILLEVAFYLFVAPNMIINEIVINGVIDLSNEEIVDIAALGGRKYFFSLDVRNVRERLESHYLVRSAEVEKVFPDSIEITLTAREPLAMALVASEERTVPIVFDSEGVVFQIGRSVRDFNLPVVSGLRFESFSLGQQLPRQLSSFFQDLQELRQSEPELLSAISEVQVVRRNEVDFELLLYPSHYNIPVRTGSELNETLLEYILMVLDVVETRGYAENMEEIDFRTGEIVYQVREE
ncbi:MAG: cell division protein FtsQ/DivIB [Spirochaetia bacterium]